MRALHDSLLPTLGVLEEMGKSVPRLVSLSAAVAMRRRSITMKGDN